jgi:hypothetical protein
MRMRILLLHRTVGSPPRVGDSNASRHRRCIQVIAQVNDFADFASTLNAQVFINDRDSSGVVATILKALKSLQ